MSERRILPVADNREKQETYREQMQRYIRAMRAGFFFEALLIDYAMLEDRLRSFLYHIAFFVSRDKTVCWKRTKPYFQKMVAAYKRNDEKATLGVTNISGKIKIVRSALRWVAEADAANESDRYLLMLKNQCESLDIGAVFETLDAVQEWCSYRNEIVHALLNKNVPGVYADLENQAKSGMDYSRLIDTQVRILKRGNRIRKSVNAPMN